MEVIRCPNPKCGRRILDDEGAEWTVLEIKCQRCGKLVRLYCGRTGLKRVYTGGKSGGGDSAVFLCIND